MKLLLLRCPRCNQALAPGQEDEIIQCPSCRSAVVLSQQGLTIQEVRYAAPRAEDRSRVTHWAPFWIFHGRVDLEKRLVQDGRSQSDEAQALWGAPRDLYVPGWEQPLHDAADLARDLVEQQPALQPMDAPAEAAFPPVVVNLEDARKLIGLVVVTIEAERKDYLQAVDFTLHVESQMLWLLPARLADDAWEILAAGIRS